MLLRTGEVLSIGSELLSGSITDTNATFLARQLAGLGITLRRVTQVGDRLEDIVAALRSSPGSAELVVCTGGIGPTPDDLTREAVAALLGEEMTVVPELEERLRAWFAGRGRPMPERNLKQATLIPSARALANRSGTAPGWWVEAPNGRLIILMPGVPVEMKTIWLEEVAPRLLGRSGSYVVSRTLKTQGLGESTIAEMLGPLLLQERPTVATYAKTDGVHVVIAATGTDPEETARVVASDSHKVADILGDAVWGADSDTLASSVVRLLEDTSLTLATQEQASAGLLAGQLLATASPRYFGGAVGGARPPDASLLLTIGPAGQSEANGRVLYSCDSTLSHNGEEVAATIVQTGNATALPERAPVAALQLTRTYLQRRHEQDANER